MRQRSGGTGKQQGPAILPALRREAGTPQRTARDRAAFGGWNKQERLSRLAGAVENCSFAVLFLPDLALNCMFRAVSALKPAFFAEAGLDAT